MPEAAKLTEQERAQQIAEAFKKDTFGDKVGETEGTILPPPPSEQVAARRRSRVTTFVNPVTAVADLTPMDKVVTHPTPPPPPLAFDVHGQVLGPVAFASLYFANLAGGNVAYIQAQGDSPAGVVAIFRRVYQAYCAAIRDIQRRGDKYQQWDE